MNLISMAKQKDGFLGEQAAPPAIVQRMKLDPATSYTLYNRYRLLSKAYDDFAETGDFQLTSMCLSIVRRVRGWFSLDGQNAR